MRPLKRALVFSGGGSRGAYECGAWQALNELGVRIDAVYGTSIGAINAALVAQGDLSLALRLWKNISITQVVKTDDEDFSIDRLISGKRDIIPFILNNVHNFNLDIAPFEALLRETINEGRIRAGGMALGVMLTRVPQLAQKPVRLNEIPAGALVDYLLASASAFPVFPMREIGGERYIDGGYADNMPISMAIEDGADEIIAVDLHPNPVHPQYYQTPMLIGVHPLHELGGFLNFDARLLQRSRMLGYYDTMKRYGRFDGVRYTFSHVNDLKIADLARRYCRALARVDGCCESSCLMTEIGRETPLRPLSWKESLLRGLELTMQALGFREDAIYDMDTLNRRALNFVKGADLGARGFYEAAKAGSRSLTAWLYHAVRLDENYACANAERLAAFPMETAAALYLNCIEAV